MLEGDQSLAVGSLKQDVKGKKQPGGCLTNAWTAFSFRSVSSMDRSDTGGREEPSLSSIYDLLAAAKRREGCCRTQALEGLDFSRSGMWAW